MANRMGVLEKAEAARRFHGLDCPVPADYRKLLDWDGIQVVNICTVYGDSPEIGAE